MKLKFDIRNCYGIGTMSHELTLRDDSQVAVVYAPNGAMKTSLTKTIAQLMAGKVPQDDIYPARESCATVTIDGTALSKDNCYVFANNDADGTKQISTFLANNALKGEYEAIYRLLDGARKTLKKHIKQFAKSTDCEEEIVEAFKENSDDNLFDCLQHIREQIAAGAEALEYDFKFNDVFEKKDTRIRDFVRENIGTIRRYFDKYSELLQTSNFFSCGAQSFGTTQANSLLKSVGDNRFFTANHRFELRGGQEITSKADMAAVIKGEMDRILTNDEIRSIFTDLDDKLGKNEKLKGFKDVIQTYPELIPELLDYDEFQKKILRGYLTRCANELATLTDLYAEKKDDLKHIVERANGERSQWERVVDLFSARFFVPFKLDLQNKSDILLNAKTPELQFLYQDGGEPAMQQERKTLVEHLSTGERKAFYILQNIFELEARRASGQQTLLVFDDIADSFDYKNKYAIIEYLNDLKKEATFTMLILTHNFDFYRTVVSRLGVKGNIYFVNRKEDRTIELRQGTAQPDILKRRLLNKITERRAFIGCVPFVRNIIDYTEGDGSENYRLLTACLHLKERTEEITMSEIMEVYKTTVKAAEDKEIYFSAEKYVTALMEEAEAIRTDPNEVDIVNKLVLSMAIRLRAEQYMKSQLTEEQLGEMKVGSNQTAALLNVMKKYHGVDKESECLLMNRVLMLTSENIHINNFMFEPLVDISILYLKGLYEEVKGQRDE